MIQRRGQAEAEAASAARHSEMLAREAAAAAAEAARLARAKAEHNERAAASARDLLEAESRAETAARRAAEAVATAASAAQAKTAADFDRALVLRGRAREERRAARLARHSVWRLRCRHWLVGPAPAWALAAAIAAWSLSGLLLAPQQDLLPLQHAAMHQDLLVNGSAISLRLDHELQHAAKPAGR